MKVLQWIEKAFTGFQPSDIDPGTPTQGGLLNNEQAKEFLRIAIEEATILNECRIETSNAPKFEVPRLSFTSRVLKPGVSGERVALGDRAKPTSGLMTLSTVLFKGEMPVSDEMFEDNVERDALADTLGEMLAQAVGRDLEEIIIKSDTDRTGGEDTTLDTLNGLIAQMQVDFPAGQRIDAASGIADYDDLFATMLEKLPARYRRNRKNLRFYVPTIVADGYQQMLAARGTTLGDQALVQNVQATLAFRGIPVTEVPLLSGTDLINTAAIDYSKFAMLIDPANFVVGLHRRVRIEQFRDPREGVTSYLPSVRIDGKFADPNYGVLAYNIAL